MDQSDRVHRRFIGGNIISLKVVSGAVIAKKIRVKVAKMPSFLDVSRLSLPLGVVKKELPCHAVNAVNAVRASRSTRARAAARSVSRQASAAACLGDKCFCGTRMCA